MVVRGGIPFLIAHKLSPGIGTNAITLPLPADPPPSSAPIHIHPDVQLVNTLQNYHNLGTVGLFKLPATYSCDRHKVHRPVQSHSVIQGALSGAESGSFMCASGAMAAVQRLGG